MTWQLKCLAHNSDNMKPSWPGPIQSFAFFVLTAIILHLHYHSCSFSYTLETLPWNGTGWMFALEDYKIGLHAELKPDATALNMDNEH